MNKTMVMIAGLALLGFSPPTPGWAAEPCPAEVVEAKAALASAQAALKKTPKPAKSQEIQAPRSQAGAKSQDIQAPRSQEIQAPPSQAAAEQDVQAPRSQDIQAPRAQEVQAPRGQDIQAPRAQEVQAPRSQEIQAPRVDQARALIRQAEAACKKGDMALAAQKAKDALGLLK